jgi:hypothetical protein
MTDRQASTVWELLREFANSQTGSFTSQEIISWFGRHAPGKATDSTIRVHTRGASWNVADRSQFSRREPFLTRVDRGLFRRATAQEIAQWLADGSGGGPSDLTAQRGDDEPTHRDDATSDPGSDLLGFPPRSTTQHSGEWHTEANVQSSLVAALVNAGARILSVANTATKEHGIDVITARDGQTIGIEVKGFPSRNYADPARADEVKRTQPSTQAAHWYSQAVLAAMRLRGKEPSWRSVIVLPDFPRYRDLHAQTVGSLTAAQIEVWWIDASGALSGQTWAGD